MTLAARCCCSNRRKVGDVHQKLDAELEKAGNARKKNFHCITFSSQPADIPSRDCVNNVTFQRNFFLHFRARLFTVENLSAASRNSKTF